MSSSDPPPSKESNEAAAAAASSSGGDATLAQALYCVETLTQVFGFSDDAANEAVNAVGADPTTCYNYILDKGLGQDHGGAVYPSLAHDGLAA